MKNFFKNIFFSFIITAVFFLSIEIVARIGYSCVKRDGRYLFYGKTPLKLTIRRIANKISSSIGENSSRALSDGGIKIWLFGGSTTQCSYEEDEKSWPYKLAVRLKGALDTPVTVVNFGKDGATCKEYVEQLEPILADNKLPAPNLVIVYMGINDSIKLSRYAYVINRRPSPFQIANRKLMDLSVAYMLAKEVYYKVVEKNVDKAWAGYLSADEKELERHLNNFINLLKDMNPKIIIFFEIFKDSYLDKMPEGYKLPGLAGPFRNVRLVIENTARKRGVEFVDTGREIRERYKDFERYIPDGMHFADEGNDIFADYLTNYLVENGILKKQPLPSEKATWQFINLRLVENPPRKIRYYQGE